MPKWTLIILSLPLILGCSSNQSTSRAHPVYPSRVYDESLTPLSEEELLHDAFDYQTRSPFDFLDMLKASYTPGEDWHEYTVWGSHRGWIQERDIPGLLELLDSDEPCVSVQKEICSFMTMEPSTVGKEAAFLINGFRAEHEGWGYGGYPPALSSHYDDIAPESLRSWWATFSAR